MADDPGALATRIAQACRILGTLGLSHSALGHVSYREPGADTITIKGKGADEAGLRYTEPIDVLEVDFSGEKVSGPANLRAPSEVFIHLWIYRQRPEVRSVVHIHPEDAVLLTIAGKKILPIIGAFDVAAAKLALDGIPVYPRSITVSDDTLGEEFANFVGHHDVALMQGHGATVAGSSVEDAIVRCMSLNLLVRMTYNAYLLGEPKEIPEEDRASIGAPRDERRPRGSAGGEAGVLASFRYYQKLASEEPLV